MGLFSFGGSRSESRSTGRSSSVDVGRSGSVSGGTSAAGSRAGQRIAFEDVFARLFGGAEGAAAGLDTSLLTETANQLYGAGTDFLSGIGGDAGTAYLEGRLSTASPLLDEQIAALSDDIGTFFSEQINPAITSEAISAGALGGGRQGVAQGIAAGEAGDAFTRGALELRAGDLARRDAIAQSLQASDLQGRSLGLSGLGGLFGLQQAGVNAALDPFARLSAILGPLTTLSESESFSSAEDFARAFSESFGASRSRTDSRTDSASINLGFL